MAHHAGGLFIKQNIALALFLGQSVLSFDLKPMYHVFQPTKLNNYSTPSLSPRPPQLVYVLLSLVKSDEVSPERLEKPMHSLMNVSLRAADHTRVGNPTASL